MTQFEVIEEITLALAICNAQSCESCKHTDACCCVFGKDFISQEILELANQCKSFNEFARANEKGN